MSHKATFFALDNLGGASNLLINVMMMLGGRGVRALTFTLCTSLTHCGSDRVAAMANELRPPMTTTILLAVMLEGVEGTRSLYLGRSIGQSGIIVCVHATDNLLRLQNVKLGAS